MYIFENEVTRNSHNFIILVQFSIPTVDDARSSMKRWSSDGKESDCDDLLHDIVVHINLILQVVQ